MNEKKFWKTTVNDSSVSAPHTFISECAPDVYTHGALTQFVWITGARCILRTDNIVSSITLECDEAGNLV